LQHGSLPIRLFASRECAASYNARSLP